jgi:hypothetical protein
MRPFALRRTTAAIATGLLAVAIVGPASPASAAPAPPWVSVTGIIGTCNLSGSASLGTDASLRIKHRRADGSLIKTTTVVPGTGSWELPCPGPAVKAGQRVEFFRGSETTPFRVFRVPRFEFLPDRANEILRGFATRNPDSVGVTVSACDPSGTDCEKIADTNVEPSPSTGAWSLPIGDLRGGDRMFALWSKGMDNLYANGAVGQLVVTPGRRAITGRAPTPGRTVTVTLRRGSWTATGRTTVDTFGTFSVVLRRNGARITPKVGDVVTADVASDAKVTVPPWFLTSGESGILGRCFKNALVTVTVRDPDGRPTHTSTDVAFEDGSFGDPYALGSDERFDAYCANQRGDVLHVVGIPG